jgi:hypothetical protein
VRHCPSNSIGVLAGYSPAGAGNHFAMAQLEGILGTREHSTHSFIFGIIDGIFDDP